MHSDIFILTPVTEQEIEMENRLEEQNWSNEDDVFLRCQEAGLFCDYVEDCFSEEERREQILEFRTQLQSSHLITIPDVNKPNLIQFVPDAENRYFQKSYQKFQNMANRISLSDFAHDQSLQVNLLKLALDNIYDIRIAIGDEVESLDTFIRDLDYWNSQGRMFQIQTVYDYHY